MRRIPRQFEANDPSLQPEAVNHCDARTPFPERINRWNTRPGYCRFQRRRPEEAWRFCTKLEELSKSGLMTLSRCE